MRIQHNIMAMSAYRNYTNNVSAMQKNLEKLSSGYKINRAGDDAAGLAISEKMRAQITGLETAQKNAKDGISLVQTAEGALTEVHDMLNRMVELATQSANGTYDDSTDRYQLQKEMDQLRAEIDRIADSSNFNGIQLLDGSMSLNKTAPITVSTTSVDEALSAFAPASGIFGEIAAPASTPGSTGDTVLHANAAPIAAGEFTIALDHVSVSGGTATSAIRISLDGGTTWATIAGTAAGALDGKKLASLLAGSQGQFVYVSANGTVAFASASDAGATYSLVYSANDNGNGTVTYKLAGYVDAAGSFQAATDADTLKGAGTDVLANLKGAAPHLNFTVSIASSEGDLDDNRQNYGTINVKDTVVDGGSKFGTAEVTFDLSGLGSDAANVKLTIGAGSAAKTLNIRVSEDGVASADGADDYLDLVGVDLSDKAAVTQKVANALNALTKGSDVGIYVGVNGDDKLTLSEVTSATGTSGAAEAIQKAMTTTEGFNSLLKAEVSKTTPAAAGATLTVDANSIYEGNTATITVDGEAKKFTFTASSKAGTTGSDGTTYIALGDDLVKDLAAALGGSASGNTITLGGSGDAAVAVGTTVGWTGNMGLTLQIGDTAATYNQLNVNIDDCHTYAMGDGTTSIADISIATQKDAQDALDVIKAAVNYVSNVRGTLGATQNRLEHTINNLSVMTENIQDAESTIRDTDVAEEMMAYTKNNILIQSAQAMLAQANQVPQGVLQLLQ